jgi:putative radical SAM enzyme (TIGR03279 family)
MQDPDRGVLIDYIEPGSAAEECGFRAGDILLSINGKPVNDTIDYMYRRGEEELTVVVSRGGEEIACIIEKDEHDDPGIVPSPINVATCRNKCVFCFVYQQPRGLRGSLYLRDDDYRMSFLYGNYITLTNLVENEKQRIVEQRLSPMYVSVHATDTEVRRHMLGNPEAPDVMDELRYFVEGGIRVHTQIVLCPGYNDGEVLRRTIADIASLGPMVLSLAVVPVGLTAHRRTELRPVSREDAVLALNMISDFQGRFFQERANRLVYGADELYIKAGRTFPPLDEYDGLPQIENGVGMVALFLDEARDIEIEKASGPVTSCLTFTGNSFFVYLKEFTGRLSAEGYDILPVMVENDFFGQTVTVAGLLSGRDVIEQLRPYAEGRERLIVPDVVLREGELDFLDGVTLKDVADELRLETVVVESSPYGLLDGVL